MLRVTVPSSANRSRYRHAVTRDTPTRLATASAVIPCVESRTARAISSRVPGATPLGATVRPAAADGSGAGRLLFVALTEGLYHLGRDWIAFTATAQVRTMFSRLGLRPHAIAEADPARLGDDASRWGRYYQFRPQVMVGHVPPGYATLTRNGWLGTGGLGYGVVA